MPKKKIEDQLKQAGIENEKLSQTIENLWDSEWQFRQLFLSSPVAMIIFDKNNKIKSINHKFIELFGFDLDKLPTMKQWQTVAFPDSKERVKIKAKWDNNVREILKKKRGLESIEVNVTCRDKSQRFMGMDFSAFSEIIVVTFIDLTEYKKIDQMKTEFVSLASHQLRTPLGGLRWTLEMLINGDLGKLPTEAKGALDRVYDSNQYLIQLVNDLLNISRIEQQKIYSQPRIVDIRKIITESISTAIGEAQPQLKKLIHINYKGGAISKIKVDKNLLKQVIVNLLANAVKYSFMGEKITLEIKKAKDHLQIKISNKGIGIPKEDQVKIFTKLFRAGNALKHKTKGSGLGLYVVKSYVESWGGRVWFDSKPDKGTNFYFTIPFTIAKQP